MEVGRRLTGVPRFVLKDAQLKEAYRENALKDKRRKEEEAAIKAALLAEGGHTPEATTPTSLRPP